MYFTQMKQKKATRGDR